MSQPTRLEAVQASLATFESYASDAVRRASPDISAQAAADEVSRMEDALIAWATGQVDRPPLNIRLFLYAQPNLRPFLPSLSNLASFVSDDTSAGPSRAGEQDTADDRGEEGEHAGPGSQDLVSVDEILDTIGEDPNLDDAQREMLHRARMLEQVDNEVTVDSRVERALQELIDTLPEDFDVDRLLPTAGDDGGAGKGRRGRGRPRGRGKRPRQDDDADLVPSDRDERVDGDQEEDDAAYAELMGGRGGARGRGRARGRQGGGGGRGRARGRGGDQRGDADDETAVVALDPVPLASFCAEAKVPNLRVSEMTLELLLHTSAGRAMVDRAFRVESDSSRYGRVGAAWVLGERPVRSAVPDAYPPRDVTSYLTSEQLGQLRLDASVNVPVLGVVDPSAFDGLTDPALHCMDYILLPGTDKVLVPIPEPASYVYLDKQSNADTAYVNLQVQAHYPGAPVNPRNGRVDKQYMERDSNGRNAKQRQGSFVDPRVAAVLGNVWRVVESRSTLTTRQMRTCPQMARHLLDTLLLMETASVTKWKEAEGGGGGTSSDPLPPPLPDWIASGLVIDEGASDQPIRASLVPADPTRAAWKRPEDGVGPYLDPLNLADRFTWQRGEGEDPIILQPAERATFEELVWRYGSNRVVAE